MTDINIGALAENLNYKSDLDLGNTSPQLIDWIVEQQLPNAGNNYTWYNKYKSGWVEQGGKASGNNPTVVLPITMSDSNYFISTNPSGIISNNYFNIGLSNITTTGFSAIWDGDRGDPSAVLWEVKGISAS